MPLPNSMASSSLNCLHVLPPKRAFNYRDFLPLNSDRIWKIERGVVRSFTWDEEGKPITLGFWGKGDVVGASLSRLEPYQVICLTPVQASQISPENCSLNRALLVRAWQSEELLSILHRHSVCDRLLRLLKWLSVHFGQTVPQGTLLNLRLTHQDIAETISASRVTVTRLMNQLEREGRIRRSSPQTLILLSVPTQA